MCPVSENRSREQQGCLLLLGQQWTCGAILAIQQQRRASPHLGRKSSRAGVVLVECHRRLGQMTSEAGARSASPLRPQMEAWALPACRVPAVGQYLGPPRRDLLATPGSEGGR